MHLQFHARARVASIVLPCVALAAAIFACSSSSGSAGVPADAGSDEDVFSKCGHPGDNGNSKGVGKFCNHVTDCTDTPAAHLCSTLGDMTRHFCLMTCTPADAGAAADGGDAAPVEAGDPNECGENATCECGNGGCGCTPNACL